jgi:Sec7-like guanine-nucleotide exchange factor
MFMCYDIHPYSSPLASKLIKHLSHLARSKLTLDLESESLIISDSHSHIQTLNLLSTFLSAISADLPTPKAKEKLNFLLANRSKVSRLEKALREGGRKDVKKVVVEMVGEGEREAAKKISEFLLYSRNIKVESVLEMIGDKREGMLLEEYLARFNPLMFNKNMEKSIRELFTSFRLAGVESQTVERVLESFGYHYYDLHLTFTAEDGIIKFATKKEAYEFAYLLIMLHTCHHNPNLENKTNFNWFLDSVKDL